MKKITKRSLTITLAALVTIGIASVLALANTSANKPNKVQFKDQHKGFKKFSYTLKEKYNSYDEVITELDNLCKEYKNNIAECSDEYVDEVSKDFNALEKQLRNELKKHPSKLDENEKLKIMFNDRIEFWEDEYIIAGKKGITKELYEKALKVKSKYDKGELSLKEAYDELNKVKFPEPGTSSIS